MKSLVACLIVLSCIPAFAGPRVDIVIGEKAPALERLAADELSSQLKRVYEAEVKISSTALPDAPHVIFVGSPDTNTSMKPFADSWPSGDKKLTDQGHLLRSVTHRDRPALLIGGGSPVATYWAVSEFGHRLGIRSMLFGDLEPATPPAFALDAIDVVMEPKQRIRCWQLSIYGPTDAGAWGASEFRQVFKQLAKLKFNRVSIALDVGAPFADFEFAGVKRNSAFVWYRQQYKISGDTAGRKVFGGAKQFENPHFAGKTGYEELIAAGTKLLSDVIDAAHENGLSIGLQIHVTNFPVTFMSMTGASAGMSGAPVTIAVPFDELSSKAAIRGLPKAQIQAFLETYPTLDRIELNEDGLTSVQLDTLRDMLSELPLRKGPDGNRQEIWVQCYDKNAALTRNLFNANFNTDTSQSLTRIPLTLHQDLLPFNLFELPNQFHSRRELAPNGFCMDARLSGDLDLAAYWLSRVSYDNALTIQDALNTLLDPICGGEVSERVRLGFDWNDQAYRNLTDRFGIRHIGTEMSYRKLDWIGTEKAGEKYGALWSSAADHYLKAMNEMYRANTRAREGGRAFTLYWARRYEFAFEYMNCVDSVRKAGIAERKQDTATEIAELEKAVESMNNALNAMAAVARSNSDRGLIAVLNENGYRLLKKRLAKAEAK